MAWTKPRRGKNGMRHTGMYYDADGNERSAGTSASKKVALKAAEQEEARVRLQMWRDPALGGQTLGAYYPDWADQRDIEVNTRAWYDTMFRQLAPLHGTPLRDIDCARVQKWVASQRKAGVKPSTIKARLKVLRTILAARTGASALRDGLISADPCYGVSVPWEPEPEVVIFEVGEDEQVIDALDPWYRVLLLTQLETGLRWGELLGLRLDDLDDADVLWINRTVIEPGTRYTGNGTRFLLKEYPKNRRRRRLQLNPDNATAIRELAEDRGLSRTDALFCAPGRDGRPARTEVWSRGLPISRNQWRSVWQRALREAEVSYRKPHSLRATHTSWMLAGGADLAAVMARTGHTQIATVQRYLAPLQDADQTALAAFNVVRKRGRSNVTPLRGERTA